VLDVAVCFDLMASLAQCSDSRYLRLKLMNIGGATVLERFP
jgi:hypothetical protein